jgi:hypothetical protein
VQAGGTLAAEYTPKARAFGKRNKHRRPQDCDAGVFFALAFLFRDAGWLTEIRISGQKSAIKFPSSDF